MPGRNFSVMWNHILSDSILRGVAKYFLIQKEKREGGRESQIYIQKHQGRKQDFPVEGSMGNTLP